MTEREATEHIGPGQPVTDENSRLCGEAKPVGPPKHVDMRTLVSGGIRKTVTLPIYGEDGTVRQFTFEVPVDAEIPPGAFISGRGRTAEESPVKWPIDADRELAIERAHSADVNARLTKEIRLTENLRRDIEGLLRDMVSIGEILGLPAISRPDVSIHYVLSIKEKLRGYLGDLRYAKDRVHCLEDKAKEDRERINRLETDVNMVELERDALKTELAEVRADFAAEVQANQRLQKSLAKNLEEAIETINALVKRLP